MEANDPVAAAKLELERAINILSSCADRDADHAVWAMIESSRIVARVLKPELAIQYILTMFAQIETLKSEQGIVSQGTVIKWLISEAERPSLRCKDDNDVLRKAAEVLNA